MFLSPKKTVSGEAWHGSYSPPGVICPFPSPEGIWQCLVWGAYWHLAGRGWGAANILQCTNSPRQREIRPQMSMVLRPRAWPCGEQRFSLFLAPEGLASPGVNLRTEACLCQACCGSVRVHPRLDRTDSRRQIGKKHEGPGKRARRLVLMEPLWHWALGPRPGLVAWVLLSQVSWVRLPEVTWPTPCSLSDLEPGPGLRSQEWWSSEWLTAASTSVTFVASEAETET